MELQEAIKQADIAAGRIKCSWVAIYDENGEKIFSLQKNAAVVGKRTYKKSLGNTVFFRMVEEYYMTQRPIGNSTVVETAGETINVNGMELVEVEVTDLAATHIAAIVECSKEHGDQYAAIYDGTIRCFVRPAAIEWEPARNADYPTEPGKKQTVIEKIKENWALVAAAVLLLTK